MSRSLFVLVQVSMVMPIPMDDIDLVNYRFAVRIYDRAWTVLEIDLYNSIERWAWMESQGDAFSFPIAFEECLFVHFSALYDYIVQDIL
jgi:hypothetical protein